MTTRERISKAQIVESMQALPDDAGIEHAIERLYVLFKGRIVPEAGNPSLREIIVGRYRVMYRRRSTEVGIATVLHGARSLDLSDLDGHTDAR
jgi:hypothetical protein